MPAAVFQAGILGVTSAATAAYVVSKAGVQSLALTDANVKSVEWWLNGGGSATLEFETTAYTRSQIPPKETEIQLWRNGRVIWWGYVERADANEKTTTLQCAGLLKYLDFRFFGKPNRTNLLTDPEFELGTTWAATGATFTYDTGQRVLGTRSAKLTQASARANTYISQSVVYSSTELGDVITLAAWYRVSSAGWVGGAYGDRGLYLEIRDETNTVRHFEWSKINEDTPQDQWLRQEFMFWMPPTVNWTIIVRLYAPGGVVWWDAVSLTAMESLSVYRTDQATIAARIVDYAQDNDAFVHLKSDLNITATAATCPPTGVLRDYHQQFAEHQNVGEALREFNELDDGFDISVEHTATTRAFHTWFPSKGTDRSASVTISNSMLAGGAPFGWRFDGEQAYSDVVVIGDGDGPDREEGGAYDHALFGGTTFETVISARTGTPIDRLNATAVEQLRALSNPESVTVSVHEPTALLLEVVAVGDLVTLDIDHGYVVLDGVFRVIGVRFDPQTEALTFELNAQ